MYKIQDVIDCSHKFLFQWVTVLGDTRTLEEKHEDLPAFFQMAANCRNVQVFYYVIASPLLILALLTPHTF